MTTSTVSAHHDCELSIVVPVYREEGNIRPFLTRMEAVLGDMGVSHEIIFALDPSPDDTEHVIAEEIARNARVRLLVFSRRFGQPAATMAGILNCAGKACVVIDVDLQDPPEVIPAMYARVREGFDVVYARRRSRAGETLAKRMTSHLAYSAMARLTSGNVSIPRSAGDFRIITRRVIEELRQLNESHGFLRGMVAYVGFAQSAVEYDRDARLAGEGKYNRFTGSLDIGLNGLLAFSNRPLRMITTAGVALCLAGTAFGALRLTVGRPSALVAAVTLLSGIQLMALGLVAEYVGRIYDEVRRRPTYIVDRQLNFEGDDRSLDVAPGGSA